jgi:excisionase family DNA binding protein
METLFNVNQAAFILKVHPLTIRRYIKEQKLKAVKFGGNVRIRETDLSSFSRDFAPTSKSTRQVSERPQSPAKSFSSDDPLLRLEGRGASVNLSSIR